MVEIANAIVEGVKRPIQFFHIPVPKDAPMTTTIGLSPACGSARGPAP